MYTPVRPDNAACIPAQKISGLTFRPRVRWTLWSQVNNLQNLTRKRPYIHTPEGTNNIIYVIAILQSNYVFVNLFSINI